MNIVVNIGECLEIDADGALSAEACQAICQATRDCKFFSYHVDRPDKRCRLCKDDTHDTNHLHGVQVKKCSSSAARAADATLHECFWGPKYCRRDDMGTGLDGKNGRRSSRVSSPDTDNIITSLLPNSPAASTPC